MRTTAGEPRARISEVGRPVGVGDVADHELAVAAVEGVRSRRPCSSGAHCLPPPRGKAWPVRCSNATETGADRVMAAAQ